MLQVLLIRQERPTMNGQWSFHLAIISSFLLTLFVVRLRLLRRARSARAEPWQMRERVHSTASARAETSTHEVNVEVTQEGAGRQSGVALPIQPVVTAPRTPSHPQSQLVITLVTMTFLFSIAICGLTINTLVKVGGLHLTSETVIKSELHEPPIMGVMPGNTRPKIILAQDVDWPPYAYVAVPPEADYDVAGFGHDIAKGLSSVCDIDVETRQTDWAKCWGSNKIGDGLEAGHYHGCMMYTREPAAPHQLDGRTPHQSANPSTAHG